MVAILTKFLGATNFRPSRVLAVCGNGANRLAWSWDHALDVEQNHVRAAEALAVKLGWHGHWYGGGTRDGYAFVQADGRGAQAFEVVRVRL
jgi:hypothetical protein